jgi:hypothetical protein
VNTGWRKRGRGQQVIIESIAVDGNDWESGHRGKLKRSVVPGGRCECERNETVDCLGTVIRGPTLQFEFDSLLNAHSDQDVAGSDPLPVSDIALTIGSHRCARDRAAGRRGNIG